MVSWVGYRLSFSSLTLTNYIGEKGLCFKLNFINKSLATRVKSSFPIALCIFQTCLEHQGKNIAESLPLGVCISVVYFTYFSACDFKYNLNTLLSNRG